MVQANNEREIRSEERLLSVFDRKTGAVVKDYKLANFDLAAFRNHFCVPDNDPLMYSQYQVSDVDLKFIVKYLPEGSDLDFERFDYFVTCYQS